MSHNDPMPTCHSDGVSAPTRIDSDNLRIDFNVEVLGEEPDGTLTLAFHPNRERYEWRDDSEYGRVLFDRNTRAMYPEAVIAGLAEQMVGTPMFAPRDVPKASTLLEQRRQAIVALLEGTGPKPPLANPSAAALAQIAGENRHFVVISVDLVSSTRMQAEQRDAYRRLVPVLLHEASAVGDIFGGVLIKYTGDGVLIGFPEPAFCIQADAAFDAACAILAVVYRVLNPEAEQRGLPPMAIRVGLDAHDAEVTAIGASAAQRQLDVMGLAVSLAAKVQSVAAPGELWVGQCLYELLHHSRQTYLKPATAPFPFVDRGEDQYKLYRMPL